MSHEMEILHRGAAFGAAIGRGAQVVAAGWTEAELPSLGATTVRSDEEPVCGRDGEEDGGEPEREEYGTERARRWRENVSKPRQLSTV